MLSLLLKERIQLLPGYDFVRAWQAIDKISAALQEAGPTASLAFEYVRLSRIEREQQAFAQRLAKIESTIAGQEPSAPPRKPPEKRTTKSRKG